MRAQVVLVSGALAILVGVACSTTTGGTKASEAAGTDSTAGDDDTTGTGSTKKTDSGTTTVVSGGDVNPYGVAYPTENIGRQVRKGTTPGNVMENFKFYGYIDGDPSAERKRVSLADYYDPEMKKYKVVHIQSSGVWCKPCNDETKEVGKIADQLPGLKVAYIIALTQGPKPGEPSTDADLVTWLKNLDPKVTNVLDPGDEALGVFYDPAGIPWNANLDARTMEVLSSGTGAPSKGPLADVTKWVEWVDANPASY